MAGNQNRMQTSKGTQLYANKSCNGTDGKEGPSSRECGPRPLTVRPQSGVKQV